MIDFRKINPFENGQRDSFESLIRVLAKRERPKGAKNFHPNDGRGGDGGVEALWICSNGEKVGYQSKFFKALGDQQWKQMDKSVAQALKTHPELTRYVFALPFDPTGERGPKAKGKSGWEKWKDRAEKWKALAAKSSITIEFELWGETVLTNKLVGNGPLRKHWFGTDVLDDAWFKRQVKSAALKLDDRFNPEDHVEVSIEHMFAAIVRSPSAQHRLREAFERLEENPVPAINFTTASLAPDADALSAAQDGWNELIAMGLSIDLDPATDWDWPQAQKILGRLQNDTRELERHFYSFERKGLDENDRNNLEDACRRFRNLSTAARTLGYLLQDRDWLAEASRCALVFGEAGSGKSHVLGQTASRRVHEGLPTIVVLGQDLAVAPFWTQLGGLLGIEGKTAEDILGVLNAAGERKRERTLLLFDAINEGAGAAYWMHWMPDIVEALRPYPYIAAVFSCRDVYSRYAIPETLLNDLPIFEVHGFATPDEQERAAKQYLDNKGISRPNTPWLSLEFSNPLFLKSASEALRDKGKTEFPLGFHGISELLALYLDGLSARTGVRSIRADDISTPLRNCVRSIAHQMADDGKDHVTISTAEQFAQDHFGHRQPPEGKTWLDVFIQANLFRRDPPPFSESAGPLDPPSDLVRFSFQRFQDFLMADALVEKVAAMNAAGSSTKACGLIQRLNRLFQRSGKKNEHCLPAREFQKSGPLNFIFRDGDSRGELRYEYAGLIGALSTIYPEKLGIEFAKTLPDWEKHWERGLPVQDGFGESFKWRRLDAFTEDARELLNRLDEFDSQGLLLEVSMTEKHPFNAERLHTHLKKFELAERDSHWTFWINWSSGEEFSQVDRIVSWALSSRDRKTDPRHMELASLVLAWSLSSSHMTLRDRATKALTTIFLEQSDVFGFVLAKMHDCNDPYIVERLYAAAFGACCIDPQPDRLKSYSQSVFAKVFADGEPPVALLTRDYALGIIELAESKNALGDNVRIAVCRPPFCSDEPMFDLTREQVEEIAEQRGGQEIFYSAADDSGDYGKYSIPGRVRSFLISRLTDQKPVSASEIKERFEKEVINSYPERVEALEVYEQAARVPKKLIFCFVGKDKDAETNIEPVEFDIETDQHDISKDDALSRLEAMLDAKEKQRLSDEYLNDGAGHGDYRKVSVDQCRLWITKRAYELGWTVGLFPNDERVTSFSRHENDLERIGKKYQRIALDELQARLADNFWILEGWPKRPHEYSYSHNVYRRNIEPTILPSESWFPAVESDDVEWITEPKIVLPEVPEAELKQWPFTEDPTASMSDKLVRADESGKRWLVLYEHHSAEENYAEYGPDGHRKRNEEFRFLFCIFLKKGKIGEFIEYLESENSIDVHSFQPREFVDGPFLGEAYWRDTWRSEKFADHLWEAPLGCKFAIPVVKYHWEGHLDKTLPDGFSNYMPQKWFADELDLTMLPTGPQYWADLDRNIVIQSQRPSWTQTAVVINEAVLRRYAAEQEVDLVWLMIAERNTWPGGINEESSWRRSIGVIWVDGQDWKQTGWHRDTYRDT